MFVVGVLWGVLGGGTLESGPEGGISWAVVPSTMVATPRAVPIVLGPLEVHPPVESQHHRRQAVGDCFPV